MLGAEKAHRGHAIVEQVIADLKASALKLGGRDKGLRSLELATALATIK